MHIHLLKCKKRIFYFQIFLYCILAPWSEFLYVSIPVSKDDLQPPVRPKESMIGLAHLGGGGVAQLEPDGDGGEGGLNYLVHQVAVQLLNNRHECKFE